MSFAVTVSYDTVCALSLKMGVLSPLTVAALGRVSYLDRSQLEKPRDEINDMRENVCIAMKVPPATLDAPQSSDAWVRLRAPSIQMATERTTVCGWTFWSTAKVCWYVRVSEGQRVVQICMSYRLTVACANHGRITEGDGLVPWAKRLTTWELSCRRLHWSRFCFARTAMATRRRARRIPKRRSLIKSPSLRSTEEMIVV